MARLRWSKEIIISAIQELRRKGIPINSGNANKKHKLLFAAACLYFGSWGKAVEAAGIPYAKVLMRLKWNRTIVISRIRELLATGEKLNSNHIQMHHRALYASAIRYFGSWSKAIKAAGYDYSRIRAVRKFRSWTKSKIISAIKTRHRKGLPINTLAIYHEDRGLYSAIRRHFGKDGTRKAIKEAGFNLRDLDPKRIWTKKKVLREIKRLKRLRVPLYNYYLANHGYQSLAHGGVKAFGSWRKAIEAAGIDYESVRAVRRYFWSKRRIIAEIKRLAENGERLSSKRSHLAYGDLFAAACSHFGGWGEAVEAAGISYRDHCTVWSYKTWLRGLDATERGKIKRQAMRHAKERRNAT